MTRDQLPRGFAYCLAVFSPSQFRVLYLALLAVSLSIPTLQFSSPTVNIPLKNLDCVKVVSHAAFNSLIDRCGRLHLWHSADRLCAS